MLDNLLKQYIYNPEDADNNYNLALHYESIHQTASAISYYLRCAERSSVPELQYECLLRASSCFEKQGKRNFTVQGLMQHAISILPTRPEAYFLLSRFYEKEDRSGSWHDSYTIASIGEKVADHKSTPLINPIDYPGEYAITFQKAVAAWWCGLCEESRDLFIQLQNNPNLNEEFRNAVEYNIANLGMAVEKNIQFDDFDFGLIKKNKDFLKGVTKEVFLSKVYERFVKVEENDIVLDVGASVGPFSYSSLKHKPKHIYCLEPHKELFQDLKKNLDRYDNITTINAGLASTDGNIKFDGLWNADSMEMHSKPDFANAISFESLIKTYNIKKIDFIKTDCEGGEYDLFTESNIKWLKQHNSLTKISGEFHLHDENLTNKFKYFRDTVLAKLAPDEYKVYAMNDVDITSELFNQGFAEYYYCIMIYFKLKGEEQQMNTDIFYNDTRPEDDWGYVKTNRFKLKNTIDKRLFVVDNFYENPDQVREFALSQTFYDDGGYLGMRTRKQFFFDGVKERFESIIGQKITDWESQEMNGRFQTCKAGTPLVYHCDDQKWAGIVYLTPNAPVSCGTSFYIHKETKKHHNSQVDWANGEGLKVFNQKTFLDRTPYEMVDTVGNIYNRLVIFDGGLIHAASEYFGWDIASSRLFHMFFFN